MIYHKIILTRGLPASGKSTWAKKWVAEDDTHRVRINFDDIRNMMGPYKNEFWENTGKKKILVDMYISFINNAMLHNFDIVIDNMNLSDRYFNQVEDLVKMFNYTSTEYQYNIEFKDFLDIPVDECIARDSFRNNPIGEKAIKQIYRRHKDKISLINNETKYNKLKQYEDTIDSSKPNCIVVDIDGTCCFNLSGRSYYGKDAVKGMSDDKIYKGAVSRLLKDFLKSSGDNDKIFFVSGRDGDDITYEITKDYIKNIILKDSYIEDIDKDRICILLRPLGNFESTASLKKSLLQKYIIDNYNISYVIEDDKKCIHMYRELGLTVLEP